MCRLTETTIAELGRKKLLELEFEHYLGLLKTAVLSVYSRLKKCFVALIKS